MKVMCRGCGMERTVNVDPKHESRECYQKRRPHCPKCGRKEFVKTMGGNSFNWKGGEHIDSKGYVRIWDKDRKCYMKKHHYVWIKYNGKIKDGYIIHHKDGNKLNNNIENLGCMLKIEHDKFHKNILKYHLNNRLKLTENLFVKL